MLRCLRIAAGLLLILPSMVNAAERIGDFSLLDDRGYFHQMGWYSDQKAIALLVQAIGSSTDSSAIPGFIELQQRYQPQGITFFMINPMGRKDRDDVAAAMQQLGIAIPVLMDDAQLVSESLGVRVTGELIIYDPRSFSILFRGPVGVEAANALDAILESRPVTVAEVSVSGDPVEFQAKLQHDRFTPSYERDIARIISQNCAKCHREDGIAPFALDSHTMVQGWSPMIREVVMTKRMPPGQVDPHIGNFTNDMVLNDEDSQTLLHWIAAGAPNDSTEDPLHKLTWPETQWAFGEPDYIIKIPPQEIPATGVLDYYNVTVAVDIDKDRWVRASQYIPGDRSVLHHTLHSIIPPGATRGGSLLGGDDPDRPNIAPYIPGQDPRLEPPNTGGLLKAGTRIAMQMHYTTNGKATVDESQIGVWFYPEDYIPQERMVGNCACIFTPTWVNIPAHNPDYEMQTSFTIEKDAQLFSLTPHMHFRGKRMRFYADYPDGSREELLNIARYNYNWQLAYTFAQPKPVPAGTVITAVGAFDNSSRNPANPDPARSVPWGLQSWDEMFFGAADWKYVSLE
ncbi:MAG: hypothetical protein WD772_02905 [Pseudohongiellaceae bacterium]